MHIFFQNVPVWHCMFSAMISSASSVVSAFQTAQGGDYRHDSKMNTERGSFTKVYELPDKGCPVVEKYMLITNLAS